MGRIKTTPVKRATKELMKAHPGGFTEDFEKNKEIISKLISTSSKPLKNKVIGYVTRLVKKAKETEEA